MPLPYSGTAARSEKPIKRYSWFGEYEMVLRAGCWDEWMESDDWLGWGRVILSLDHEMRTLDTLAATDNGTLKFGAAGDFLVFDGTLAAEGDDPGPSMAQADVAKLAEQKLQRQVSIGFSIEKGHWEWADDEDNDLEVDRLVCEKILIRELSLVPYGAMGDDATIGIRQEMSMTVGEGAGAWKLSGGGVKLYEKGSQTRELAVDAWHARDKAAWTAAREAKAAAAVVDKPAAKAATMTVTDARAKIQNRKRG